MCSRTGSRSLRASSGSRSASNSIEPFKSANSTVTCLRSPSRAALEVRIFSARYFGVYESGAANLAVGLVRSGAAHWPQNLFSDGLAAPQDGHDETAVLRTPRRTSFPGDSRAGTGDTACRKPPSESKRGRSDRWRELSLAGERGQSRPVGLDRQEGEAEDQNSCALRDGPKRHGMEPLGDPARFRFCCLPDPESWPIHTAPRLRPSSRPSSRPRSRPGWPLGSPHPLQNRSRHPSDSRSGTERSASPSR